MSAIQIDGEHLDFAQLDRVVFDGATAELAPQARTRMLASRAVIERLIASDQAVYGVNTGFGKMASVRISREQISELQVNLVRSHACGVGTALSEHETRAMLLLRANAIAKGFSGVRPIVAETLCAMLNSGVHPVIPSQGSVGASGDLAPLAHLAQVAIGEGEAILRGRTLSGGDAMRTSGIAPLQLEAKEGLALLNAGGLHNQIVETFQVLYVERRPDADPRSQQLFDVLPSLCVPRLGLAPGDIRVCELIDQHDGGTPRKGGVQVELLPHDVAIHHLEIRQLFESLQQAFGFVASVRFDISRHDIDPRRACRTSGFKHGIGLADPGRGAEIYLQAPANIRRLSPLERAQYLIGIAPRWCRHQRSSPSAK